MFSTILEMFGCKDVECPKYSEGYKTIWFLYPIVSERVSITNDRVSQLFLVRFNQQNYPFFYHNLQT